MKKLWMLTLLAAGCAWSQAITISPADGSFLSYDSSGCVTFSLTSNIGNVSGVYWIGAFSGNPMYTPSSGINFTITAGYPMPIRQCNIPSINQVGRSTLIYITTAPSGYTGVATYTNPPLVITISPANGSTLGYDSNGCVQFSMVTNSPAQGTFWIGAASGNPMYTPAAGINYSIAPGVPLPISECNVPPVNQVAQSQFSFVVSSPPGYSGSALYNNPPNPAQSSFTVTSSSGVQIQPNDDYDPTETLSLSRKVKFFDGTIARIPRGDLLTVGQLSYSFTSDGRYSYTFDNSKAAFVRITEGPRAPFSIASHGEPSGWLLNGVTWHASRGPQRGVSSVYSIATDYKPGLVPIYFMTDVYGIVAAENGTGEMTPLPMTDKTDDNIAVGQLAGIRSNSLRRFVIGPAFPPGVKREDVLSSVQTWVEDYGFSFLAPLLSGGSLESLSPSNQLETDIVTCLRGLNVF